MTRKQAIVFAAIAAAAAVALTVVHLLLPINAGWAVNHYLHYGWQALIALAGVGGGVWLMWRRPRAKRRDFDRAAARRRVIGVAGIVLAAVFLIIFGELHREAESRVLLDKVVLPDLQVIAKALTAYAADHQGARPKSIEELAPQYLDAGRLYYVYRNGPVMSEKPAEGKKEPGEVPTAKAEGMPVPAAPAGPPPSYAIVKETPGTAGVKKSPTAVLAYLRPGNAWAPLTAVVEENGQCRVVSEDNVRTFERQFETK
jgi:hypothetical protein